MDDLREKYLTLIAAAADEAVLEELRVQAVGKKGEISLHMRSLGKMSPEERQVAGPALNALKDEVNSALNARKSAMADAALEERLKSEWFDVTLPGRQRPAGTIHQISQVWEEVTAIFSDMGFSVAEGPQLDIIHFEKCLHKLFQAPLQIGHGNIRVQRQTFNLMKHRRVGLIIVSPIHPTGADNTHRRAHFFHRADLNRACMGAQNMRRAIIALSAMSIERIHLCARRMVTGHVECVEIIPVGFDLRPFGH